ncbi:MAG TPA: magnesium/cobalt transporter CorA [Pseudobdellovibrionaceae bacterium]|nr:magnesium/cobalt transporter CorA [Pseudobdellovibrionaceae bacterium]
MLVNCVAYKEGQKAQELEPKEILNYLKKEEGFIWVALVNPEPSEIYELQRQFTLHPLAVEDTLKAHQRPKIEEYENSLFFVMHAYELENEDLKAGEVHIFAGPNYILSVRHNYNKGFADVRERCEREPHLLKLGPGFILYALIDAVVDRYFPIVSQLEDSLEDLEEQIFKQEDPRENIELLYALKHKIILLKHSTADLLEAISKLHGGRVPALCMGTQEYFRDVVDHLHRINQAIETTREMLITAIHVNLTMISIGDSRVSKSLAAWAAILAIPTMIAGVYGMNFRFMPELESPWGYPITLLSMVLIDIYLFYRFKKSKWI